MSDFSSNWTDLTRALDTMQRHYAQAGAQARLDVERRVQRWSHAVPSEWSALPPGTVPATPIGQ